MSPAVRLRLGFVAAAAALALVPASASASASTGDPAAQAADGIATATQAIDDHQPYGVGTGRKVG